MIIPFFERHPLISKKGEDFRRFARIVRTMQRDEHRTDDGFRRVVELAFEMNQHGKQRKCRIEEVLRNPQRLHAEHSPTGG